MSMRDVLPRWRLFGLLGMFRFLNLAEELTALPPQIPPEE